ncbi:transcription factor bHLH162-like [Salvia splendens]|uniref:transcription factor bHLH162-like n=1 Tax=Salvia splendens TaxID=180675 RepID=UPI001C2798EB|nr:transcription factor bHLH162-like [Salvia splendens]
MGKPGRIQSNSNSDTAPKIERKIIEKNRRTKMKNLYNQLVSLLPHQPSPVDGAPLPDQIDEAVEHIKGMTTKLEKLKQKRDLLLEKKKQLINNSCVTNIRNKATNNASSSSAPLVEVQDMGPNLDVILANDLQNYTSFRDIVRLVHQHGVEIASASFGRDGNSSIQVLHDKVGNPKPGFDGATITRKMKELACNKGASSMSEVVESDINLWDYEIDSKINWGFEIPEVLLPGLQEFMITMNKCS